jgi:DNA invertase Pin-like site-specific DNA recombinase
LDRKGDHATIERQLASCRKYVEDGGNEVAAEFVDRNVSAYDRKTARPEYERMRAGVQGGLFDAVCIWKVDRLSRRVSSAWRARTSSDRSEFKSRRDDHPTRSHS